MQFPQGSPGSIPGSGVINKMYYIQDPTIDPGKFTIETRVVFLHELTKYAPLSFGDIVEPRKREAMARKAGLTMQKYALVIGGFKGRMPDREGEDKLSELLELLEAGHAKRRIWRGRMATQLDQACLAYQALTTYFEKTNTETSKRI